MLVSYQPTKSFSHISEAERAIIRRMRHAKSSCAEIARYLDKHRSTISREIRRNTNAAGIYFEGHAQAFTRKRRMDAKVDARIIESGFYLEEKVERLLQYGLSPEQAAGFLRRIGNAPSVSYGTIYNWIRRKRQSRKLYLRHRGKPRIPYGQRKNSWDQNKRHIRERPRCVDKRERVGDWEADLVHGTQDDSRHCILTLNERATGFAIGRKISAIDSTTVAWTIIHALRDLLVKTITCDNGSEFGRHKLIERKINCKVYFTDPNSPQQRGSNENFNGLLREFFPKGKSLKHVTQEHVTEAIRKLNARPPESVLRPLDAWRLEQWPQS